MNIQLSMARSVIFGGIVLSLCGCDTSVENEEVAQGSQALMGSMTISLPAGTMLNNVVVSANGSIDFGDRAQVLPNAGTYAEIVNFGSGQTAVGADAVTGTARSVGSVLLRNRARVNGNVQTTGTVASQSGAVVTGSIQQGVALNPPVQVTRTANIPGGTDINVASGQTRVLAPGNYGRVTAFSGATLSMTSGIYSFVSLDLEPNATWRLTVTGSSEITVNVEDNFQFKGVEQLTGGDASKVVVSDYGSTPITIERPFQGIVFAGNKNLRLATYGTNTYSGSYFARNVTVSPDVKLVKFAAGPPPTPANVLQIAAGTQHTCALLAGGTVKCWGANNYGQLGRGDTTSIDNAASSTTVNLGGIATQISVGGFHACALLSTGAVRCWGLGDDGQLGYGNPNNLGDNEAPGSAGDVPVGGTVTRVSAGFRHTCAIMSTGAVRCWGSGAFGRLGYGNTNDVGDDETPASVGDVPLGNTALWVSAGNGHSCATLTDGNVRCWGNGSSGQLGYGNTNNIGDNETPASAGNVNLGFGVTAGVVEAGGDHTCAVTHFNLMCWGSGAFGQLGYRNTNDIGDNEQPWVAGQVGVSGFVYRVDVGRGHTCALMDTGMQCFGSGTFGALGYGNTNDIGDDEFPLSAGNVPIGGNVGGSIPLEYSVGDDYTCTLVGNATTATARCWGSATDGKLGYGTASNIGDNETPASVGDLPLFL